MTTANNATVSAVLHRSAYNGKWYAEFRINGERVYGEFYPDLSSVRDLLVSMDIPWNVHASDLARYNAELAAAA